MFGIPVGLLIRAAAALIVVAIISYCVHLYNESVRESLRVKYEAQIKTITLDRDTALAANIKLQKSLGETEEKVKRSNEEIAEFKKRADDAAKTATEEIARIRSNAAKSRAATDALVNIAKGPPSKSPMDLQCREADRILTEYATDIAKAREVLGIK